MTATSPTARAASALKSGRLAEAEAVARDLLVADAADVAGLTILACVAKRRQNFAEVVPLVRAALKASPGSDALHSILCDVLLAKGDLAEAEGQLRAAAKLRPESAPLQAGLGRVLAEQGRYGEAEVFFRLALAKEPKKAVYLQQAARTFWALGRREDAIATAAAAVEAANSALDSEATDALLADSDSSRLAAVLDLGGMYAATAHIESAIALFRDVVEKHPDPNLKLGIAGFLCEQPPDKLPQSARHILSIAIDECWTEPSVLCALGTRLLLRDKAFDAASRAVAAPSADVPVRRDVLAIAGDPLLHSILKAGPVANPRIELFVTDLRRSLLQTSLEGQQRKSLLKRYEGFLGALAVQSFTNEFAFSEREAETKLLFELEARASRQTEIQRTPDSPDVLLLACYRSLANSSWAKSDLLSADIDSVREHHVRFPATVASLAESIPRITAIGNGTSLAVQAQYEENPYPRWARMFVPPSPFELDEWLSLHFPATARPPAGWPRPLQVLVAGCGTGRDAISASRRFADSNVLAIDLSCASLSYALARCRELGVGNISFAQADILELRSIDRRFHVVDSAGVLHHLEKPIEGFRALRDVTEPGGYMMLALYSRKGRQSLAAAREFARAGGYGSNLSELRRFRADVLALERNHPVRTSAVPWEDFYSLSMLRDLLFHACEREFTIREIEQILALLGLEFCGFATAGDAERLFAETFNRRLDTLSLRDWELLEDSRPQLFSSMYHFLVRKPE